MKSNAKPEYDSIRVPELGNEPSPRGVARGEAANRVLYIVCMALLVLGAVLGALVVAGKPGTWENNSAKLGGSCVKEARFLCILDVNYLFVLTP